MQSSLLVVGVLFSLMLSCCGSSSRLVEGHVAEDRLDKPITDILILVIIEDQEIRKVFEKHFKDWFTVKGVEAISSVDVLPINERTKLDKEAILQVVDKHENDAILITNLVEFGETEVFSRDRPRFDYNYYGFYNYAWGYVYWPTVYGEKVQITLETRIYDVKTESLIWSGESRLKNPKTTGTAIGDVVTMVIRDLDTHGLLPQKE
jgi:hypothetical protein